MVDGIYHLIHIMRRNVGRHPHRDARRAIEQQVRHLGGENRRLLHRAIKVLFEIHRTAVNIQQNLFGDFGQARFGVSHRGRGIVVNRVVDEHAIGEQKVMVFVYGDVVNVGTFI